MSGEIFESNTDICPPIDFETSDLLFSAILYSKRKKLNAIKNSFRTPGKKIFVFEMDDEIPKLKELFLARELMIEPLDLWACVRHMKSLVNIENMI